MFVYICIKGQRMKTLLENPYAADEQGSLYRLPVHPRVTVNPETTFLSLVFTASPELHRTITGLTFSIIPYTTLYSKVQYPFLLTQPLLITGINSRIYTS